MLFRSVSMRLCFCASFRAASVRAQLALAGEAGAPQAGIRGSSCASHPGVLFGDLEPLIPTALLDQGPGGEHALLEHAAMCRRAKSRDHAVVRLVQPAAVPGGVLTAPAKDANDIG